MAVTLTPATPRRARRRPARRRHRRRTRKPARLFEPAIVRRAAGRLVRQAQPPHRRLATRSCSWCSIGSVLDHASCSSATCPRPASANRCSPASVAIWLWFTVLFANFAEAVAEGRGKAQADTLRKTRTRDRGHVLPARRLVARGGPRPSCTIGDLCVVDARAARSPATATSSRASPRSTSRPSPASRPRSSASRAATAPAVTGGTRVLSDRIVVQDHHQAGRELHRPDDRPGRRGRPAEDAQRDRPQHPAGRPHHHLPAGGRHPAALRHLLRRRRRRSRSWSPCWSA